MEKGGEERVGFGGARGRGGGVSEGGAAGRGTDSDGVKEGGGKQRDDTDRLGSLLMTAATTPPPTPTPTAGNQGGGIDLGSGGPALTRPSFLPPLSHPIVIT